MAMTSIPTLSDSRRLTGANLHWDRPSAIIDLACETDPGAFINAWQAAVQRLLNAVGYDREEITHRRYAGGASLLVSAPIDVLYSMCELNEVAFAMALAESGGPDDLDYDQEVERLRLAFAEEANLPLLALQQAAHEHGVPFLWDDDEVSVGYGATALVWTPDALPDTGDIDWASVGSIPVAMVTGTNGKSTTVRMAAAICSAAGLRAGLTSTDWIRVGANILDTGDYSGTGGARTLMRHPDTEIAVLETARGGLLRRGLGLETVSAAVITNVAADHLGDYGINTVPELIEAKFIVRRALHDDAPLILNGDDPGVVEFASRLDCPITWFSLDPANPVVTKHLAEGGKAALLENNWLALRQGENSRPVIETADIPAALGGAALHNVHNALAAMALCDELGVEADAIRAGLMAFRGDEQDNPGRSNWFEKDGVRILVDFAHNEHGMKALADMLARVSADRKVLLMSQAGDRLDNDIRGMTSAACAMRPDRLLICELPGYERGREAGEVPAVIRTAAMNSGVPAAAIDMFASPRDAVSDALEQAAPGDLLVLLVLTQREEALALVHEFIDS
jgi:UDP-N-acetylmuramyl tripeptide synthase